MIIILPKEIEPGTGPELIDADEKNVIDDDGSQVYVFGDGVMYSNVDPVDDGEPEWDADTTYGQGDIVTVLGDVQRRYESTDFGNVGNFPPDSPADWLDLGSTNRWRMFDGGTSTKTTNTENVAVTLEPVGFINAIAIFGVEAGSVRVVIKQQGEVQFDQTGDFLLQLPESNWWSWFFGSVLGIVESARDSVILNIPGFFDPTVELTFSRPDGEVSIALVALGRQQDIGIGIYGTTVGIRDFSTKEVDTFGNFRVVERRFAKRAEIDVYIPTQRVAQIQQALAARRAKPTVYVGSEKACLFCPDPIHEELLIYGFYTDFDIVLNDRNNSSGTIELEGL
jgi:hypothetical protein